MKVKLEDVIDGLEAQSDETHSYLNRRTGEVIWLGDDMLRRAEDEDDLEGEPAWMVEAVAEARDVLESGDYLRLPYRWEIDEYRIMEEFCITQVEGAAQTKLLDAIRGKGAFRRFKDRAHDLGLLDRWYVYRGEQLARIAIEWCEENGIECLRSGG